MVLLPQLYCLILGWFICGWYCIEGNALFSGEGVWGGGVCTRRASSHSLHLSAVVTDTSSQTCTSPCQSHTSGSNLFWFPRPIPVDAHSLQQLFAPELVEVEVTCTWPGHFISYIWCYSTVHVHPFFFFFPSLSLSSLALLCIKMHAVPSLHFLWRTCLATYLK